MTKNINDASLANLKHYEGKWQSGQTRTIRVPIALADATLEYARKLDIAQQSNIKVLRFGERDRKSLAAEVLNRLRVVRRKSTASLADVEAILKMILEES